MRLNLFLPMRRAGDPAPGLVRRALRRLGPTWEAAPLRRITQVFALAAFLVLFLYVTWPYGSKDYASLRDSKEVLAAETFLALDPLVSLSTAVAARAWVWSLAWAGVLLAACLVWPRGFCGYLCPLGTLIDLADTVLGRRPIRRHAGRDSWWRNLRYGALVAVMASAAAGVLLSGFLAAMPILVRGMALAVSPLQMGVLKGWYLVPPMGAGQVVGALILAAVLVPAILGRRLWCRCLCPSGAVFSVANLLRMTERKVDATCTGCGKCREVCPFGAIRPDFSTRGTDCTFCQTCGGVCPVGAIRFAPRWEGAARPQADVARLACPAVEGEGQPLGAATCSRRRFLAGAAGGAAAIVGGVGAAKAVRGAGGKPGVVPIRPPGSVPEPEFLRLCIRCGACYQACPNNVLQPMGLTGGLNALWTPEAVPNWSGCEPSCNNCGHVCPTGAIRDLAIGEKRAARMGLAVVNIQTCLPYIGFEGNCRMCYDECRAAGYDAIEFVRVGVETDTDGKPIEGTGYLAPVVLPEKCNGCGLCQTRCHKINVLAEKVLDETAIRVVAGPGKEDRLMSGSYRALRESEQKRPPAPDGDTYLPEFLK